VIQVSLSMNYNNSFNRNLTGMVGPVGMWEK